MHYAILHKTRFRYSAPVSESITEVRMQPRSEGAQLLRSFKLSTSPSAIVSSHVDCYGNVVHHFDIPGQHRQLTISAEAIVLLSEAPALPAQLDDDAWAQLDALTAAEDHWDFLMPSRFTQPTPLLADLAAELGARRRGDPLGLLRELNSAMYRAFAYDPKHTEVDSPIDQALAARKGVCQDFAHIMIALVRGLGIPCRYVSGYLFHRVEDHDRSEQDASHAWVEALLPGPGWVGLDPTNNLIAGERHIRVAVGRDYADVPPTRGVFRGNAESNLDVGVKVLPREAPIPDADVQPAPAAPPSGPPSDGMPPMMQARQAQQ